MLFQHIDENGTPPSRDIVALTLATQKTGPFAQTRFDETEGRFSPDGRRDAYASNESGAQEVYVRLSSGRPQDRVGWTGAAPSFGTRAALFSTASSLRPESRRARTTTSPPMAGAS
jgi:Tol biopolymer transport system component